MLERARARSGGGRFAGVVLGIAAALGLAVFVWIVGDIVGRGIGSLSWDFLRAEPLDAGRAGGIGPILVSTALILTIAIGVAAPLGLATAVFLSERLPGRSRGQRLVSTCLDVLAAVPSIAFGLFGNALFCRALGLGFSIVSGGLTLACMILPWVTRTVEQHLRSVPDAYRLGGAALALSRTTIVWRLVLPSARRGLVVGVVLGTARAAAETAALLFTSGSVMRWPTSLLDSGRTVSVHIYELSMNVPGGSDAAYGAAVVLLVALLGIQALAKWLTERWLGRGGEA